VSGLTLSDATSVLEAKGLSPGTITGWKKQTDKVRDQHPGDGRVPRGTTVDLNFSKPGFFECLITGNC
jgi:beta-lactam-binding protein with PASTA domain